MKGGATTRAWQTQEWIFTDCPTRRIGKLSSSRTSSYSHFRCCSPDYYPSYDNFDAIEVARSVDIPMNYDGVMGFPITWLGKYNPNQFEIVDLSRYMRTQGMSKAFVDAYYASGQTGQISEGHPDLCYYDKKDRPVVPYMRVLIRRKDTAWRLTFRGSLSATYTRTTRTAMTSVCCDHCAAEFRPRQARCIDCGSFSCPTCDRCECNQTRVSAIRCEVCFIEYPGAHVSGTRCHNCT